jgi:TetR/AcrR family transcriptional regulator, regulator of autoinduction and epiphytic fitness
MEVTAVVRDRRAELKARIDTAIVDAARALIEERGGPDFGVDDLARRADVARRTVFNHFASLDEVLLAVYTDTLAVLVDDFLATVRRTAVGDGSRASMFDELAAGLHASDLRVPIATLVRAMGGPAAADRRADELTGIAFARIGDRLRQEVARRHPTSDALDVELLVGSLMQGLAVIARQWLARTEGRVDEGSRAEWDRLLDRLLHSLRSGYLPT